MGVINLEDVRRFQALKEKANDLNLTIEIKDVGEHQRYPTMIIRDHTSNHPICESTDPDQISFFMKGYEKGKNSRVFQKMK